MGWANCATAVVVWTGWGGAGSISRMKKAAPAKGKKSVVRKRAAAAKPSAAGGKMKEAVKPKGVEEYLARVPNNSRAMLNKMRTAIRSSVPAEAAEIISYGIPAFRAKKVLVWYAAFSDHCSLFPTAAVIEQFREELGDYSTSKGTIHFPLNKSLPIALIKKMVKARVAQAE